MNHLNFNPTPITKLEFLSQELGVNLFMKRDDLFEHGGGGSKARMLQYIIYDVLKKGSNYIVTAGGPYSNFNRALALMCGKYGLKMRLVLYNKNRHIKKKSLNKRLTDLCDVEYVHTSPNKVEDTISEQILGLKNNGKKPYFIWGGGKSKEGVKAYAECVKEMFQQINYEPALICSAIGTGTTICGLTIGAQKKFPRTKIIGYSVAREKTACIRVLKEIYQQTEKDLKITTPNWFDIVNDDYLMGGYGKVNKSLEVFINRIIKNEGIILDNIYVGKALYGLYNSLKSDRSYQKKNIIFLNSGGLYNF